MAQLVPQRSLPWVLFRCLAWTLLGWLLYALVHALWTFATLGAPFFDWQEYLAIIALLIGALIYSAWRPPRPRSLLGLLVLPLAWAVAGWSGFGQVIQLTSARHGPISISYWTGLSITQMSDGVLDDLRSTGGQLYFSVGKREVAGDNTPTLVDGLRRLEGYHIPVYLSVRASDYLSVPVHDEWIDNVRETVSLVRREQLTDVRGFLGDAENPAKASPQQLRVNRAAIVGMAHDLHVLAEEMRQENPGLALGVTALWWTYLDMVDSDLDWALVTRSTIGAPADWDWVNVMAYSSYVSSAERAYYLYLIEQTVTHMSPNLQPSYLIGLASPGNPGEPVLSFDELVRDARLSRAMGIRQVVVYKLDSRALQSFGPDLVRRLYSAVNEPSPDPAIPVPFSRPASLAVYGLLAIDGVLDMCGWRGLSLVGWAILSGWVAWKWLGKSPG